MWLGDVFKKVLANLITIAVICVAVYFFVVKFFF